MEHLIFVRNLNVRYISVRTLWYLMYKGFNGRANDFLLLQTPNFNTVYGTRLFEYNGSRLWNSLPVTVRAEEDIEKFKRTLKTILFDGNMNLKQKAFKYRT